MWGIWVEPIIGWIIAAIGVMLAAAGAVYGKRLATWLGRAIGAGIIETLRAHWSEDLTDTLDLKLEPLYTELQIGEGSEKWPNGSSTLPETMDTIYRRQSDTYGMVRDIQRQLESVLIERPFSETTVRAEHIADDVDGTPI